VPPAPLTRRGRVMGDDGMNTQVWTLGGDKENPISTLKTLRGEFGYALDVCKVIFEANRPTTGDELVRKIKFGLIDVPTEEEAREQLRRQKNKLAAARRKATIARNRTEAAMPSNVVSFGPRSRRGEER
jgi:hypothetical protein